MTKLHFIPEKGSTVYIAPTSADSCVMDFAAVDLPGLISYVEKRLGRSVTTPAFNKRLCRYYIAAQRWFDAHAGNVMCGSFKLAPLSTVRQLLLWRDELKMALWNFEWRDENTRLGALAGIEGEGAVEGMPDRLCALIEKLSRESHDFSDLEIVLPTEKGIMRPNVDQLLTLLEKHGARVSVIGYAAETDDNLGLIRRRLLNLDDNDNSKVALSPDSSLEILEFETVCQLDQYMAVSDEASRCSVWINPRSKETDNRMIAVNKPTVGSSLTSKSRILGMLPLALSLFDGNLNIHKIVEWLRAPLHPLPATFRYKLAQEIARTGGFTNEDCHRIMDNYIDGEFEYAKDDAGKPTPAEIEKGKAERREKLATYLPYLYDATAVSDARKTLESLKSWASQRANFLDDNEEKESLTIQLNALADGIATLLLLFEEQGVPFNLALAKEWVNDIPEEITLPHCPACVGGAFTVENPYDIAAMASHILWSGLTYSEPQPFDCDFLIPSERRGITAGASIWERKAESRYRYLLSIMPLLMARDTLKLAYAEKDQGQELVPHPVISRIMALFAAPHSGQSYKHYVQKPNLASLKVIPVTRVSNKALLEEHNFANAHAIKLPTRISATGLETFVQYPFDYLFDKVLGYRPAGLRSVGDIDRVKGNVAHAVIASFLSPLENETAVDAATARARFDAGYEPAFRRAVNECGALLLLPAHKLDRKQMEQQLKGCVSALIEIMSSNNLKVLGCEVEAKKYVDIHGTGGATGDPDLDGRLDIKLVDASGAPVVIDMKWTPSDRYKSSLEKNRSIQLAVYAELLALQNSAVRTGYFVMPDGRLYTTSRFIGNHVAVVSKSNNDNIMEELLNSLRYRCDQFMGGVVEQGETLAPGNIRYHQDSVRCKLFPLEVNEGGSEKSKKKYSNYTLFKGL